MTSAEGQKVGTAVITGGTGGIGLETGLGLAQRGWRVIVTGRESETADRAVAQLTEAGAADAAAFTGDLADQASLRALAADLSHAAPRIDALVLNAGALDGERRVTADGVARMIAVNHVAVWLLAHALTPSLAAAAPSKVVIVSSAAHRFGKFDGVSIEPRQSSVPLEGYGDSKLLNLLTMFGWAETVSEDGISVLAVDPGSATTTMTDAMTADFMPWAMRPLWPIMKAVFARKDPAETRRLAARSSLAAVLAPEFEGRTRVFVGPKGALAAPSRTARSAAKQAAALTLTRQRFPAEHILNT